MDHPSKSKPSKVVKDMLKRKSTKRTQLSQLGLQALAVAATYVPGFCSK